MKCIPENCKTMFKHTKYVIWNIGIFKYCNVYDFNQGSNSVVSDLNICDNETLDTIHSPFLCTYMVLIFGIYIVLM